jgi:hypothetical protein
MESKEQQLQDKVFLAFCISSSCTLRSDVLGTLTPEAATCL